MKYKCKYCKKEFQRENTLAVHVCEKKRRYLNRNEPGVLIGYKAYLRFYEITQGSKKTKTYEEFSNTAYYRAFVKFGYSCRDIRCVNIVQFTEWLIKHNKKLDNWCSDRLYTEFLEVYLTVESVNDALTRAIEESIRWNEKTGNPTHDYLRYGNINELCYAVTTGRISGWVLYNCNSGQELLTKLNKEQIEMLWPWITSDIWAKKFKEYPEDMNYAKHILKTAGW